MSNGKLMCISVMYQFRVDPGLGIEKIARKRIPYTYGSCLE